nr:unnamed protein product [Callosobruchus chinensis]
MESKKRATNFSANEESLLIELVKKYRNIIECKKSDTNALRRKTETWINVAKEFNSLSGVVYREANILRSKYENLKKRAKYKFAEEKTYQSSTGGGPSQDVKIDAIDNSIKELIGTQITGFTSTFDDGAEIIITNDCDEVIQTEAIGM